jgi:uncharacterized protein
MLEPTIPEHEAERGSRCPVCGQKREPRFRPFCSAHCRDRDLLNWLDGSYAVPAVETDEDPEGEREQGDPPRS